MSSISFPSIRYNSSMMLCDHSEMHRCKGKLGNPRATVIALTTQGKANKTEHLLAGFVRESEGIIVCLGRHWRRGPAATKHGGIRLALINPDR